MSQLVLYSPFGSGLPEYEYRKKAHTLDGIYTSVYNPSQEERFLLFQYSANCPDSTDGTALNASSICMSSLQYDGTKIRII